MLCGHIVVLSRTTVSAIPSQTDVVVIDALRPHRRTESDDRIGVVVIMSLIDVGGVTIVRQDDDYRVTGYAVRRARMVTLSRGGVRLRTPIESRNISRADRLNKHKLKRFKIYLQNIC